MATNEPAHRDATTAARECQASGGRLVTTSLVLAELVSLGLRLRLPHSDLVRFVNGMTGSAHVLVVHVDAALQAAGWSLFCARPDKSWSLVDCVSFALMEQLGLDTALTGDHHFEQAGFTRLLAG